jgi:hypothetical protein
MIFDNPELQRVEAIYLWRKYQENTIEAINDKARLSNKSFSRLMLCNGFYMTRICARMHISMRPHAGSIKASQLILK